MKATVILFKPGGKYYTEEEWEIPENSIGPYDMDKSPDFRRIDDGPVLVPTQEPWGFPHIFPTPVAKAVEKVMRDLEESREELHELRKTRGKWS